MSKRTGGLQLYIIYIKLLLLHYGNGVWPITIYPSGFHPSWIEFTFKVTSISCERRRHRRQQQQQQRHNPFNVVYIIHIWGVSKEITPSTVCTTTLARRNTYIYIYIGFQVLNCVIINRPPSTLFNFLFE